MDKKYGPPMPPMMLQPGYGLSPYGRFDVGGAIQDVVDFGMANGLPSVAPLQQHMQEAINEHPSDGTIDTVNELSRWLGMEYEPGQGYHSGASRFHIPMGMVPNIPKRR